jgi:NAD(P)-dependent dehydrogenase (short-subunit alcohol dehydrogenase family)
MSSGALAGRVAFVTGTGPNLGSAIALALAAAGASVACNDLEAASAASVADAIVRAGGKAVAVSGDVADPAAVDAMIARATDQLGTIDILVNNAAFRKRGGTLDVKLVDWHQTIETVLTGSLLCSQAVATRLIAAHRAGTIINMASASGHRAQNDTVAYSAAKGGLLNLTRAMALDLAPHRIRVVSISPTRTGDGLQGSGRKHELRDDIPLGRLGATRDVADAVCFLASDRAGFITGTDLAVDGGSLATWGPKI